MSRVAVLKGGRSLERQVSLASGGRVEDALERLGHEVTAIDVGTDLVVRLRETAPEVAFVALHGRGGEDGTIQELLEVLEIPYTGSPVHACMRCSDKVLTKHALRDGGLPTPDWVTLGEVAFSELGAADALASIQARLAFPLVIKPASQGSSLGVTFARSAAEVPAALIAASSYGRTVVLERYVSGRELAVSVLSGAGGAPADALPIVEAVPRGREFYDFAARYEIGRIEFTSRTAGPSSPRIMSTRAKPRQPRSSQAARAISCTRSATPRSSCGGQTNSVRPISYRAAKS